MSYLVDNDFAIKLAQTGLLQEACAIFGFTSSYARRLSSLKFLGPKIIHKKKLGENVEGRISRQIIRFCNTYPPIDEAVDPTILEQLSSPQIQGGEALLLSRAIADPTAILLTGDKRCVIALATDPKLIHLARQMHGRIEILETTFSRLIDRLDFDKVRDSIVSAIPVDGMLDLAFSTQEVDREAHARAALRSAETQILKLMPNLIRVRH